MPKAASVPACAPCARLRHCLAAATHAALERGVDVRGFFHWTAVDNYEWLHGYDVSFGLIDGDRTVRPSAEVIAEHSRRRTT